jgi:transcriptional regulator GlxA family with amidase domain
LRPAARSGIIVRVPPSPRKILIVAFPDVQALDITGPSEVFSLADRIAGGAYSLELGAADGLPITTSSGLRLLPHRALPRGSRAIDTLVVAGGFGVSAAEHDERLIAWLRAASTRSRRVASVCTGAFLLARAGLLDGRRATTHWAACRALAERHPEVEVAADPIYVRDGNVYTSAGVTAGIDLALGLVEEDLGPRVAVDVARALVLFIRRPGGQAQFSVGLAGQMAQRPSLRDLQDWMSGHLDEDLSASALAARSFMSTRNFARVFCREVGTTPAVYVELLRVERARLLLETTDLQLAEIVRLCGFGTIETLRRSFARRLHVSPAAYRTRFRPRTAACAEVIPIGRAVG